MSPKKEISRKQNKAISALLEKKTLSEVAEFVGINRKTLYRWMTQPEFQQALRAREGGILDRAARRLILLTNDAIDALEDVLNNPTQEGAHQRRHVAVEILNNVIKLWELRNIEQRITELEKAVIHEKTY